MLQPYASNLPTAVRDTDQINRELCAGTRHIAPDFILITYDIVRLYPSIPHSLCFDLLLEFLHSQTCKYAELIASALKVILRHTITYCLFDGDVFQQIIGFATGISCGAEVANIFIFALTAAVFARYARYIAYHRRVIDDGFLLWTGTRAMALAMFAELNAINRNIQMTFDISAYKAIFLDLTITKGAGFLSSRVLDTQTFQKAINKYLYTPFLSEHPLHCFTGLVHGEVIRYIKRYSHFRFFLHIMRLFKARLRLRGYTAKFLADAFKTARRYKDRSKLLNPVRKDTNLPSLVFSTTFSRLKREAGLTRAVFLHRHMLPSKFDGVKFIIAHKAGRKLGG